MIKLIDYLIFHLDCLYKRMDSFKHKDRIREKIWLAGVITIFFQLNFSSIDKVFLNRYFTDINYYFFHIVPFFIMIIVYYFFVKKERFLGYGFKESYKGYVALFILFIIMIILMIMVKPITH